jgi:AcrR family transcriptional regulator
VTEVADPVKRPYRSRRRWEQAEQNARARARRAGALFGERGYRATIAAVAAAAGVADETVYGHFGNERTLLGQLVERAVRGAGRA